MNPKKNYRICVVEDDVYFNRLLTKYLNNLSKIGNYTHFDFDIRSYYSAKEFLKNMDQQVNIVLLDYYLDDETGGEASGLDVLRETRKICKDCKVIIISAQKNMVTTVEALRSGAYDYVVKDESSLSRTGAVVQKILSEKAAMDMI